MIPFKKRSVKSLEDTLESASKRGDKNILIVSHGMTISAMVDGIDKNAEIPDWGPSNATVTIIKYKKGKLSVEVVGDKSYIEKGMK